MHQWEYEIVPQIILIALFKTHVIPGDQIKFYASIKYKTKMSSKYPTSLTQQDTPLNRTLDRKRGKHFWTLSALRLSRALPVKKKKSNKTDLR